MKRISNILTFVPAYNVEKTISDVIEGIIKELPESFILVVDDHSEDKTYQNAKEYEREGEIEVIKHDRNMGYGAVQKTAFKFMLKHNFKYSLMIHGDGQHNPRYLKNLLDKVKMEGYDIALGSRMKFRKNALSGGMPLIKFFVNMLLTKIENISTGLGLSEFHSGYRAFSHKLVHAIENLGFLDCMSDDYIFDQQILFFASFMNFRVSEIPVDTRYNELSRQMKFLPGIAYSFETIKISFLYILFKRGFVKDPKIFLCAS